MIRYWERRIYKSTGPEILEDTQGGNNPFVSSMGTTGHYNGHFYYLKGKKEQHNIQNCWGAAADESQDSGNTLKWP